MHITETIRKGDGIAREQGFVIFVKDARAKVTSVGEIRYGRNCCIGIKRLVS